MDSVRSNLEAESAIRTEFDAELRRLGVDCYTIYVQDIWKPLEYIPHEVDPQLYYHEPMYGQPTAPFIRNLLRDLYDTSRPSLAHHPNIFVHAYNSTDETPPSGHTSFAAQFPQFSTLYDGFMQREKIERFVAFTPRRLKPLEKDLPRRPPILLFYFRWLDGGGQLRELTRDYLYALADLADRIFRLVDVQTSERAQSLDWFSPLRKTFRRLSYVDAALRELTSPNSSLNLDSTLKGLWELCFGPFDQPNPGERATRLATVHTLECGDEPKLCTLVSLPTFPMKEERDQLIQASSSITVCTTLTGRTHLLNHVDPVEPERYTSIALPAVAFSAFQSVFAELERLFPENRLSLVSPTSRQGRGKIERLPARLRWRGQRNKLDWTRARRLCEIRCPTLVPYIKKLAVRTELHYGDMFKDLHKQWERPSCELCLPIRSRDGFVLGCINLEYSETYRFFPHIVGVLSDFAQKVGYVISSQRVLSLMERGANATQIPLRGSPPKSNVYEQFAHDVMEYFLCDHVDVLIRDAFDEQPIYRLIACSKGNADAEKKGSSCKWTSALGTGEGDVIGFAVFCCLADGASKPTSALAIKKRDAQRDADYWRNSLDYPHLSGFGAQERELIAVPLEESDLEQLGEVRTHETKATILIGVRIGANSASPQEPAAVMWSAFYTPTRIQVGNAKRHIDVLLRYVRMLLGIGAHLSSIPLAWASQYRTLPQILSAFRHAKVGDALGPAANLLEQLVHDKYGDKWILEIPSRMDDDHIRALVSTYYVKMIAQTLELLILDDEELLVSKCKGLARQVSLRDVVYECWLAAQLIAQNKYFVLTPSIDLDITVLVYRNALSLVLVNIFTNLLLRSNSENATDSQQVEIRCEQCQDGGWALSIRDFGVGLNKEQLNQRLRWQPQQGLGIIDKLGMGISGGKRPLIENADPGCRVTLFLKEKS
ncbi:hypothetical protein RAS2_26210 [Phycisphaerae bacterium RAS2]|nr:hypothetical protein RAS2_26210 [Phycisphaerae bacterium RAS2]